MSSEDGELEQARATIAQQAAEIERLRRGLERERLADDLHKALILAATTGTLGSPVTHAQLLQMIVETAAHVISARAAALFLLDEEAEELVFQVALGSKAEEVKRFRVPLGHGIAGLVAMSGQPMAVSDAASDPLLAKDIAESVGYAPQSILCVPLFYADTVIGVIELLDKRDTASFDADDMEALSLFASQAAVALKQSLTHRDLGALLLDVLGSSDEARGRGFTAVVEADPAFEQSLELARLVHEIASRGDRELDLCRSTLRGLADYLGSRPGATTHPGNHP